MKPRCVVRERPEDSATFRSYAKNSHLYRFTNKTASKCVKYKTNMGEMKYTGWGNGYFIWGHDSFVPVLRQHSICGGSATRFSAATAASPCPDSGDFWQWESVTQQHKHTLCHRLWVWPERDPRLLWPQGFTAAGGGIEGLRSDLRCHTAWYDLALLPK